MRFYISFSTIELLLINRAFFASWLVLSFILKYAFLASAQVINALAITFPLPLHFVISMIILELIERLSGNHE